MTSVAVVENKISAVEKYLKILSAYRKFSLKRVASDVTLKGAVERYLYLAVQATIELAEAVVAFKKLRKPSSYRESFDILYEEKILSRKLHESLVKMTGFRNIIAHDYEKVDFEVVYNVLVDGVKDVRSFLAVVRKKLKVR